MSDTSDRLAAIRARLEAATPGPWRLRPYGTLNRQGQPIGNDRSAALVSMPAQPTSRVAHILNMDAYRRLPEDGSAPQHFIDAELIAHAPDDIAWLLDEVERLLDVMALCDVLKYADPQCGPCSLDVHDDCHRHDGEPCGCDSTDQCGVALRVFHGRTPEAT